MEPIEPPYFEGFEMLDIQVEHSLKEEARIRHKKRSRERERERERKRERERRERESTRKL
jgi:hypothetical protein